MGLSARAKSIAKQNQIVLQSNASLNLTSWAWRWKTPRSRARKTRTQARKPIQCQAVMATSASMRLTLLANRKKIDRTAADSAEKAAEDSAPYTDVQLPFPNPGGVPCL